MKKIITAVCVILIIAVIIYAILSHSSSSSSSSSSTNTTCNKNEEYVGNACQCINGYTRDLSGKCLKADTDCKGPNEIYNALTNKCDCKNSYYRGPNNVCIQYNFQPLNDGYIIGVTDDNEPVIIDGNTIYIGNNTQLTLTPDMANMNILYGIFKGKSGFVTLQDDKNAMWGVCEFSKNAILNKTSFGNISSISPFDMNNNGNSLAICYPDPVSVFIKNANTDLKWKKVAFDNKDFYPTNVAVGDPYQCIFGFLKEPTNIYINISKDNGNTWNTPPIALNINNSVNQPQVLSSVILENNIYFGVNYGSVYKMDLTDLKPHVILNIGSITLWPKIYSYNKVLFFLGNETNYTDSPCHIYVSNDNGNTFSEPIPTNLIPLACTNLFYNNNTLYVGRINNTDKYVWKTSLFLM